MIESTVLTTGGCFLTLTVTVSVDLVADHVVDLKDLVDLVVDLKYPVDLPVDLCCILCRMPGSLFLIWHISFWDELTTVSQNA